MVADEVPTRRLPPGPQRLTPKDVIANQRGRLVDALIELVGVQGYTDTSVADVLARSGVSRKSFYELFADLHELLKLAFTTTADGMFHEARASCERARRRRRSLDALVGSICERAHEQPGLISLWSLEIAAAGPEGFALRDALMGQYARLISAWLGPTRDPPAPESFTSVLAGAMHRDICARARHARAQGFALLPVRLARWMRSYHPTPPELAGESPSPWSWIEPDGLAGGRAPGTLTLSPDGHIAPIGNSSPGFRAHASRERILDAVAQLTAQSGYAQLSKRAIIERAEVSERAFREQFNSGSEAFRAALELGHLKCQAIVARTRAGTAPWPLGVQAAIHALLEFLASEPCFTRLAFVDAPLAQPGTARRSNEHATAYARLVFDGAPRRLQPPPIAAEAIVHALFELAYRHAATDRIERLPGAATEATYLALAPFLGAAEAAETAGRQSEPADGGATWGRGAPAMARPYP